nr:MAG TPA: hypothetical protein [Caudoviricetes sp.]
MSKDLLYSEEEQKKIIAKMKDPSNKTGLPSATLVYAIIDMLGAQANMIQSLQESIQRLESKIQ